MNRGMRRHQIDQLAQQCLREKKFIKAYGEYFTPHEFLEEASGKWVFQHDLTIVDPKLIIENGRKELYRIMSKQFLFEKKVNEYFAKIGKV